MQLVREAEQKPPTKIVVDAQGLAGLVLEWLRGRRGLREVRSKQMNLIETLPLGGKRHLMLISCAGERFLVGGGLETVETIVRIAPEIVPKAIAQDLDATCQ